MAKKKTNTPPLKRLSDALGLVTKSDLEQATARAYESGYSDGNDDPASGQIAAGGFGYRRATSGQREGGISWSDNLKTVWALWQSNPIGHRATELKRDYVTGGAREITFKSADDDLDEILNKFWDNNKLDSRIPDFALQLFLFGGQCYPVFVRDADGAVRLAYIDPDEIEDVIAHPDNSMEMWAVVVKPQENARPWEQRHGTRVYRIIRKDESIVIELRVNARRVGEALKCDHCGGISSVEAEYCDHCNTPTTERITEAIVIKTDYEGLLVTAEQAAEQGTIQPWEYRMLESYGLSEYSGSCFYYRTNAVSNQVTGYGDMLSVADFMDQWDGTMFALGERELFRDFFSFDVTMEGANDDAVRSRAQNIRKNPPARGAANIHNEKETWEIFAPDLGQSGSVATSKEQKETILGGLGYPVAWYGSPAGAHLATLQAQGDPTWRGLSHDQGQVWEMINDFLSFQRDQAIIAGSWNPKDVVTDEPKDGSFAITMPEMTARDIAQIAGVLSIMSASLAEGVVQEWITPEQAKAAYIKALGELGADVQDVKPETTEEDATDERPRRGVTATEDAEENIGLWRDSWFARHAPVSEEG